MVESVMTLTLHHEFSDIVQLQVNTLRSYLSKRESYHMLSDPQAAMWTKPELVVPGSWSLGLKETELVLNLIWPL